jgi:hypothetical protein
LGQFLAKVNYGACGDFAGHCVNDEGLQALGAGVKTKKKGHSRHPEILRLPGNPKKLPPGKNPGTTLELLDSPLF